MSELIDLQKALYRRNNAGQPTVWFGKVLDKFYIEISYGILGKTIINEHIKTHPRIAEDELKTRINTKRKNGYLALPDVADNNILPVEETAVIVYLNTYLPYDRQSSTGAMLPMLAKLYDNTNNKLFKNNETYIGQPKINGLRGEIGAAINHGDMFKPIKLIFQSREGTYWDSLGNLEEHLLKVIPKELIIFMIDSGALLDGEMYIPGPAVNDMNSLVKNTNNPLNKKVQFWCYDIAIPEMTQEKRLEILENHIGKFKVSINSIEIHHKNKERFVYLPNYVVDGHQQATILRDAFIRWGFEGLIGRKRISEYQFGKRNSSMWKYKSIIDGKFLIVDIQPEGNKRDIPLLTLRNDINNEVFKCHVTGSFEYQKSILDNWRDYISKMCFVEYGERSGVNQLPFHIKTCTILI